MFGRENDETGLPSVVSPKRDDQCNRFRVYDGGTKQSGKTRFGGLGLISDAFAISQTERPVTLLSHEEVRASLHSSVLRGGKPSAAVIHALKAWTNERENLF